MAENYFDNKLKDASVNVQRKQKTFEAFDRLPDEFTIEDVVRCFNLGSSASARKKVTRLCRDHLIEKISEEKGGQKALFQKTGNIMLYSLTPDAAALRQRGGAALGFSH